MNIPDGLLVPQQLQWLLGSSITGGSIGAFLTWFLGIRKTNAEIRKLRAETANIQATLEAMKRRELIERLALTLVHRAECLDPNQRYLTKAGWAAILKENANLIDEVFLVLKRDELLESTGFDAFSIGYKANLSKTTRG